MRLEARDLHVDLSGRAVVKGVSLDLGAGEVVAVIGPNGAGKSTLLRALAGILSPSSGAVLLDGAPAGALDRRARARHIAYLPQERTVHWPLSVRAIAALGRLPHARSAWGRRGGREDSIEQALADMDLTALADRPVTELSGGERARALLARALAQEAAILIADEPTAGLDPAHALALFQHVTRLAAKGRSVLLALHDLSLAARFCSRILVLRDGERLAFGPPAEVLTEAVLARAYGIKATLGDIHGHPVVLAIEPLT